MTGTIHPFSLGSLWYIAGQLPRTPRSQYSHRHSVPFAAPYSGGPAFDYLTPPPSLCPHRVLGYVEDTNDRNMSLSAVSLQESTRQPQAVLVPPPTTLPTSRVTCSPVSSECAHNVPHLLAPQSFSPNVCATEQPSPTLYSPSPADHIKDHPLMAFSPHATTRHSRYAHDGQYDEPSLVAPQPISASSRTVASSNYALIIPSDALGLDFRPQPFYTGCPSDVCYSDSTQEAGPSTLSDPPQSRWSQRLRRLAPPPIQVPRTQSRFSWTSGRQTPCTVPADEESQDEGSSPSFPSSPHPHPDGCSAAEEQTVEASQCEPVWAPSGAVALQRGASSSQHSLPLQSRPYEDRLERAAGIYAEREQTVPRLRSPRSPPPLRQRPIPLPLVTARSDFDWRPPTGSFAQNFSLGGNALAGPSDIRVRQYEADGEPMEVDTAALSPLEIEFQRAPFADWDDITSRCLQAVDDMKYVLGSCALISVNETNSLIGSLTAVINIIRTSMSNAPNNILELEEVHVEGFSRKYFDLLSSLTRNMDMLFLQVDHIRDRPPRINKIGDILDKLWRYVEKFEDLGRRLQTYHDHAGVLHLHTQLRKMNETAEVELEAERSRRRAFEDSQAQARARRREVRAEIRRAKEVAQARRDRRGSTQPQRADSVGGHSLGV